MAGHTTGSVQLMHLGGGDGQLSPWRAIGAAGGRGPAPGTPSTNLGSIVLTKGTRRHTIIIPTECVEFGKLVVSHVGN